MARYRHIHEQFASSNQALSEYHKCSYFRNAINHHQHMRSAYESYVLCTPLVGAQTLTTQIIAQASNSTATAADTGYAALVTSTIPEYFQSPAALLTRTVQHAIAPASAAATQKKADSGNRKPNHYCYLHGHNNTHNGSNCFKMLADSIVYTDAHLTASTPTMVANGSTSIPGEQRRNNRPRV